MKILHLGCGRKRWDVAGLFAYVGLSGLAEDASILHLDADARLNPDLVCTLGVDPIPLPADSIDLVIAWHVLEHIGKQGESAAWFFAWEEIYRVLKPKGWLYAECPYYDSVWAWGDPTHTRAISEHSLVFFNQDAYREPNSMISPYRIACDLPSMGLDGMPNGSAVIRDPHDPKVASLRFARMARKPLRAWWNDVVAEPIAELIAEVD